MWKTIDSTQSVVLIINTAVPYYIAGVAVAIGFKMNLFNIGSNGQYLLAALVARLGRCRGEPAAGAPRRRSCSSSPSPSAAPGPLIAGDPERDPQRQRRRRDDHAQLHRDRPRGVPALRGVPRRGERRPRRPDQADAGVGSAPVAQPRHRTRRVQLRSGSRAVRVPAVRHRTRASRTTSCSTAAGSATTSDCRA